METFELDRKTLDVVVEDRTTGRLFALRHTLRMPTDADWLAYSRASSTTRVVDGAIVLSDAAEAQLALWDRCIASVDDQYLWQGVPVMAQPDWKAKIPAAHKLTVVQRLLNVRVQAVDGPLA